MLEWKRVARIGIVTARGEGWKKIEVLEKREKEKRMIEGGEKADTALWRTTINSYDIALRIIERGYHPWYINY